MNDFEELASTSAAEEALARLRSTVGESNGPMERHCLRVRHIAAQLGSRHGWQLDDEVLTVAAILHDVGIYPAASRGGVYTADGAALAREMLAKHGWSAERIQRCSDAIDRHHDVRSQLDRGGEVEAIRRADLIDVSGGIIHFGLQRAWLRELNHAIPRRGLGSELRRVVGRALRERPTTVPRIFWRR